MKRSGPQKSRGSTPAPGQRTRFAVDAMHGSLARKLRAIGFDASYYAMGDDDGIIRLAASERRIILTSDRSLAALAASRAVPAVLLAGKSDGARLREVSAASARTGFSLRRGDPLCSICGGPLETLKRGDVSGRLPPSVVRRHRLFYRCSRCGQLYWRGSHWKKLRSFARQLEEN